MNDKTEGVLNSTGEGKKLHRIVMHLLYWDINNPVNHNQWEKVQ